MAAKIAESKASRSLIPPDESLWEKYSPHYEAPLAGATSLFLHGSVIGLIAIAGMAFFWAAREEAAKPPRMDVVMLPEGSGIEGLGGEPGSPGNPNAGQPKRTETFAKLDNPNQPDRNVPRAFKEPLPELGLPTIEDGQPPLPPELRLELEKIAKDAADQIEREMQKAKGPETKAVGDKPGIKGTGNPKGVGGQGGSGDGPGKGNKFGPGTGKGGFGGTMTKQRIFALRWNFDVSGDGKEHARKLANAGVHVGFFDAKDNFFLITDINRRPADFQRAQAPDFKKVVFWTNGLPQSMQGLAKELQLPAAPKYVLMLLPKDREEKMAAEEERFAKANRRKLETVRRTVFDFELRNGVYEPKAIRMD